MIAVLPSATDHVIQMVVYVLSTKQAHLHYCASVFLWTPLVALQRRARCTSQLTAQLLKHSKLWVGKWSHLASHCQLSLDAFSLDWAALLCCEFNCNQPTAAVVRQWRPVSTPPREKSSKGTGRCWRWHATNSFNRHSSGNEWLLPLLPQVVITMTSSIMSSAPCLVVQPLFLCLPLLNGCAPSATSRLAPVDATLLLCHHHFQPHPTHLRRHCTLGPICCTLLRFILLN